jgi:WD40 repeat protein
VVSAAFSSDERLLATGSFDGSIAIWDLASGKAVMRRRVAAGEAAKNLAFAPAGDALVACHRNGQLRRWDLRGEQPRSTLIPGGCAEAAFTDDGTVRAQMGSSSESREIDQESDYPVVVAQVGNDAARARTATVKHRWNRVSVAVSAGGRYLAAGTDNGSVYLWNLQSDPPQRRELSGHAGSVPGLAFSADGATLASGGHDGTIRLWNVSDGTLRQPPRQAAGRVDRVRFNSSGTRLAALYVSSREPPALQLWDVAAGIPIGAPLRGDDHGSIGNVVALSASGRWVVAGGDADDILLLDTAVEGWRAAVCRFANRNLSPTDEWPVYFPGQPYRKTCPNLPLPAAVPRIRHDLEEETF